MLNQMVLRGASVATARGHARRTYREFFPCQFPLDVLRTAIGKEIKEMNEFLAHIKEGLGKSPKKLSSRYFYDERGDALFQQIMQLDEYYLPAHERAIIGEQGEEIAKKIAGEHKRPASSRTRCREMAAKPDCCSKRSPPILIRWYILPWTLSQHILEVNAETVTEFVPEIRWKARLEIILRATLG